jgi:hypothetical protein
MEIRGADYASKALRDIEIKLAKNIVRSAVMAGARVVVKQARAMAPVKTGQLRRQIRASSRTIGVSGIIRATVKQRSTKKEREKKLYAKTGHLIVGGTRPHTIPKDSGDRVAVRGQVYSRVKHPGSKPYPFFEMAAQAVWKQSINAFSDKLDQRLLAEVAKRGASQVFTNG